MGSKLRFWFVPCPSGDFRLTALTDDACRLIVEDPTVEDYAKLQPFLATMVELGWLAPSAAKVKPKGLTTIDLKVDIGVAGPLLVGHVLVDGDSWTAVRSTAGRVVVNDGVDLSLDEPKPEAKPEAPKPEAPKPEAPTTALALPPPTVTPMPVPEEAVAAATLAPPRRGCPPPTACERRASEVLRAFCSGAQWRSWEANGRMAVIGNYTGIRYTLFHRNEAAARGFGHVLLAPTPADVSKARRYAIMRPDREVCVWRQDIPPEEEALGIKLAVEHREQWLLAGTDGEVRGVPAAGSWA